MKLDIPNNTNMSTSNNFFCYHVYENHKNKKRKGKSFNLSQINYNMTRGVLNEVSPNLNHIIRMGTKHIYKYDEDTRNKNENN